MRNTSLLFLTLLFLFQSCANYHLNYTSEVSSWANQEVPNSEIVYSVFLVGDLAEGSEDAPAPIMQSLKKSLSEITRKSAVVFLGNNLPHNDIDHNEENIEKHEEDEIFEHLLPFLEVYDGRVFFVAGEHEWNEYGVVGLHKEAKHIRKSTKKQAVLLPRPGCGDPVEVKLTKNIVLLLLDSQWWIANWEGERNVNNGCEAKSRADFSFMIREAIKSNRRKETLVAMHHPIYSKGPHGGDYSFNQHLFPLRDLNENLYIPLPGIGTAFRLLQGSIGGRQDLANATYKDFRNLLLNAATLGDGVVFAAGHEHSMQYWEKNNNYFIVNGSGAKKTATRTGNGALFAYSDYGFSRLDYYGDGQVWVNYFKINMDGGKELVFRHQVKKAKAASKEIRLDSLQGHPPSDSMCIQRISKTDFERTSFGQKLWGKHYRKAYGDSILVKGLNIESLGLVPVKQGGGFQTNSLRLEHAKNEKQYTLRSIDKDASRTVPYPLNSVVVLDLVTDNFSASHPLAATAVAPLAETAGVYHSNPEIVYLPPQKALGDYNESYADALYLFEERPDDDHWKKADNFGNPKDVISTFDMIEKVNKSHKNRIDQRWVIRSRLFDLLIGDWDRHDDQWRWAEIKRGDYNYFRPIPRDRDQAFANYDGFIFAIARKLAAKSGQWRPFTDKLGRVNLATYNAFLFDQSFLTALEWKDWEEAVLYLQSSLTDESIKEAFDTTWPEPFITRDAPPIMATIKGRRDKLATIARDYYEFLAQKVDVLGTGQKDLFLIERIDNEHTRIRIYATNKSGDKKDIFYDRLFKGSETNHIACYALDGDDIFEVRGKVSSAIKIHLLGGYGEDTFDDQSQTTAAGALIMMHDFKNEDNLILNDRDSRDKRNSRPENNLYNRRGSDYLYDFNMVLPFIGFNPDDKGFVGFTGVYTTYGFQKEPFASQHQYSALYSLGTGGANIEYTGDFTDVFRRWDFQFDFLFQTPLYQSNYFGLGNETISEEEEKGEEYNHLNQRILSIAPKLSWHPNDQFQILFGPRFRSMRIERTLGRFIDEIGDELDPDIFEGVNLMNIEADVHFNNTDVAAFPSRGIRFHWTGGWSKQLGGEEFDFLFTDASFAVYQQLDSKGKLVAASRIGVSHRFSDNFPFYRGAQLGGNDSGSGNLRGFLRNRFTGQTAFYQNTDLRWKMFRWNNHAIPGSVGISASFDYGKVALDDIHTENFHFSYGGGVFFLPFDLLSLQIGAYKGQGGELRWLILGGFFF